MMRKLLGGGVRSIMEMAGYSYWKRAYLPNGVIPSLDIERLNAAWGRSVKMVFDVGANAGETSISALKTYPKAQVHAFEPHPVTFGRLTAAISDPRFTAHNLALGEKEGEVSFYEYGSEGMGSYINSLTPDARFATRHGLTPQVSKTACSTIDTFCRTRGIERIDVLKIDTEGYDLFVLQGAEGMLRNGRVGFVYTEFNDLVEADGVTGGALLPIANFLAPFGYRFISTYTDSVTPSDGTFVVSNALFALPPPSQDGRAI